MQRKLLFENQIKLTINYFEILISNDIYSLKILKFLSKFNQISTCDIPQYILSCVKLPCSLVAETC